MFNLGKCRKFGVSIDSLFYVVLQISSTGFAQIPRPQSLIVARRTMHDKVLSNQVI